jgi:hypothetical protein
MKISEGSGRSAIRRSNPPSQWGTGSRSGAPEAALIVTPIAASSTTGVRLSRAATGWLNATRTSRAEKTARTRTMSTTALNLGQLAAFSLGSLGRLTKVD